MSDYFRLNKAVMIGWQRTMICMVRYSGLSMNRAKTDTKKKWYCRDQFDRKNLAFCRQNLPYNSRATLHLKVGFVQNMPLGMICTMLVDEIVHFSVAGVEYVLVVLVQRLSAQISHSFCHKLIVPLVPSPTSNNHNFTTYFHSPVYVCFPRRQPPAPSQLVVWKCCV